MEAARISGGEFVCARRGGPETRTSGHGRVAVQTPAGDGRPREEGGPAHLRLGSLANLHDRVERRRLEALDELVDPTDALGEAWM